MPVFANVANRVRGRSARQKASALPAQQQQLEEKVEEKVDQVHIAPELLRWSDFSTPFPSVSIGGYTRFYATYTISKSTKPLPFGPLLYRQPAPAPSSEIPPKSLLFDTPSPSSLLPMIPEASSELLGPNKLKNLTITTDKTPPRSLRRRRRRLLRTPSIELDFALLDIISLTAVSPTENLSTCSSVSSSSDSHGRSDSEFPITPSTSVEEDGNVSVQLSTGLFDKLSAVLPHDEPESALTASPTSLSSCCTMKDPYHRPCKSESVETRPINSISYASYCTASSGCSQI